MAVQLYDYVTRPRERPRLEPIGEEMTPISTALEIPFLCKEITFTANGTGHTYLATWQNPESTKIMIWLVIIRLTAAGGTAGAICDTDVVGDATSNGNTIFDGVDINTTGIYSSWEVGGGGTEQPHIMDENGGTNDWLTFYEENNTAYASLAGKAYVFYTKIS